MRDLHDKSLSSGLFLIELLAAVEPRCVDRALVTPGVTEEEQKLNAKYAISSARKIGCTLFLLWEDIVEVSRTLALPLTLTPTLPNPKEPGPEPEPSPCPGAPQDAPLLPRHRHGRRCRGRRCAVRL